MAAKTANATENSLSGDLPAAAEKPPLKTPFKKQCPFCGKQFAYLGTYGRHLDSRKGDDEHPAEKVAELRQNVVRRGPENTEHQGGNLPGFVRNTKERIEDAEKTKQKRKVSSKAYNEQEPVRERNKLRRKQRDEHIKAKIETLDWVLGHFSAAEAPKTFTAMVCLLLPPLKWPSEVPNERTFDLLLDSLSNDPDNETLGRLHSTFNAWERWPEAEKRRLWGHEVKRCLHEIIGNRTLYDILTIPRTAEAMMRRPPLPETGPERSANAVHSEEEPGGDTSH